MKVKMKSTFLPQCGAALADKDIRSAIDSGYLKIKSPFKLNIQPSSIDVHLAPTILTFRRRSFDSGIIDLKHPVENLMEKEIIDSKLGTILHPREFILGVTKEWVSMPLQLSANVDGKSSLGRLGLVIHATAGFIDPGFEGHITLEITNLTELPMRIYANMPIGQIRFTVLTSPVEKSYGHKSLKSKGYRNPYLENPSPIASQYYKNFTR